MTESKEQEKIQNPGNEGPTKAEIEAGVCFVCHGVGHWARECTSLPGIYLTEDAPRCYRCNGVGHFARFCPNSVKQWRLRERRASLPVVFPSPSDWGTYFDDLGGMVPFPDQVFYIRPDYDSPDSFSSVENYNSDGDSAVEYAIEDVDSVIQERIPIPKVMVDTAIDANKNE